MQTARKRAHRYKRSTGRLLIAGLGFSAAYFFDATQGRARRRQVVDAITRARGWSGGKSANETPAPAPDLPRLGRADPTPRATFQRAADGIRASARV